MKKNEDVERKKVRVVIGGLVIIGFLPFLIQNLIREAIEQNQIRKEEKAAQMTEQRAKKEMKKRDEIVYDYIDKNCEEIQAAVKKAGITDLEVSYNYNGRDQEDRTHYENGKEYDGSDYDYTTRVTERPLCDSNGDYPYCFYVSLKSEKLDKIAKKYSSYKKFMKYMIRIKKIVDTYINEETILPYKDDRDIILKVSDISDSSEFTILTSKLSWNIKKSEEGKWELYNGSEKMYPEEEIPRFPANGYNDGGSSNYSHSGSNGSSKYNDLYDSSDYDDPDDFADDWAEEFGDGDYDDGYDDAYDYWEEEND